MSRVAQIALTQIVQMEHNLRSVNKEDEQYLSIRDSVQKRGIINAISVRPSPTEPGMYVLIDGLHRFTAAQECGFNEIAVSIMDATELEAMELQVIANASKVETKRASYAQLIARMLSASPNMSIGELCQKLHRSQTWVQETLSLAGKNGLDAKTAKLVDDGVMPVGNAVQLVKLPISEREEFIQDAMTKALPDFQAMVLDRNREIRKAARSGVAAAPVTFNPHPSLRPIGELKIELETGAMSVNATGSAVEGWNQAIAWVLKMDAKSLEMQKNKFDAEQSAKLAQREKDKAERDAKKIAQARELLAQAGK